ncbi:hypothetical protein XTGART2_1947 [Xanthomonas translucens pv. graminis]|uniref:Uncharacterized protein n=1 Tax=Xanthomonas graminis pv. graminis TaxID=134874 RepID=A0A1M4IKQ9_9XANT|nr:hypothetical protein XTGART2_1947 [Xanthomonas translucens pv. graminis]SBV47334.1 hypothetical protein XTGART29_1973 [Xanthomonas translucens pv. graminis ART-Xtg29]SBV42650.1 hypothetical protein XTGART9_1946 [Xanthomonas translucens pv. graminis]SBV55320.1 hypothetical protein XTGART10_1954 [Xanthomonas translucens pv. graminis]SBV58764.1 hypothetical protein XTGICMP6431_1936 [Xanthomonas translucens pv. graminis]
MLKSLSSKRVSPPKVPSHKKPSRSCTIAFTEFCGRPSWVEKRRTTSG